MFVCRVLYVAVAVAAVLAVSLQDPGSQGDLLFTMPLLRRGACRESEASQHLYVQAAEIRPAMQVATA